MDKRTWVSWEFIEDFMVSAFVEIGVPLEDAKVCADVLMESDRRGIESHGCNRFKPIYIDRINAGIQLPVTKIDILRETPTTAVLDANDGMGMVASKRAMDMAIEKAKKFGMGMVAVRNSTHYGIAGYWATMASDAGMIGITGTNARPSIAPTFGVENMLGTNPLTFALPTDEEFPFVLDCATSITQRGKIEYYSKIGKDTPEGMVVGRDGLPKTDSNQILKDLTTQQAALAPLGGIGEELAGYKGYGYATVVEILSAALQAGNFLKALSGKDESGNLKPYHLGHFFIAIDTEAFMGLDSFKKIAGNILRDLRNSELAPGEEKIYTAGEKEYLAWQERKDKGVPLNEAVMNDIKTVNEALKLNKKLPF
ncbi:putative oxidoreductase YjmC [Candidatus Izimaplasma bacterium HR1]|jgi:LDH2 family malate/lactate/ureidoglycolate dehydrogenase|uniref:Ldh family oxidoreductase n=1 Tax=Candidatus Izimoplasma sp. HR1 TaxID=1541959 RepID=UPI0004F5E315|nr:putative oxidoreductase YjmC [Candidatus Izimaplasma bacterium HR1]